MAIKNELSHHGIKGMKWGVRRTPEQLGHRTGAGSTRRGGESGEENFRSEMGRYSNRITDMILKGAGTKKLTRVISDAISAIEKKKIEVYKRVYDAEKFQSEMGRYSNRITDLVLTGAGIEGLTRVISGAVSVIEKRNRGV